jgi:PST family polysaccharide transporter
LARFYDEPRVLAIAAVMSTHILIQMFGTQPAALLKREMKFGKVAVIRVISCTTSVAFAVAAALIGFGIWSLVIRQLSEVAVMAIGSILVARWRPGRFQRPRGCLEGMKYAVSVYGSFVLTYVSRSLDKVLLGRFFGSYLLGNYDRAYFISSRPAAQLVVPLHGLGISTLSRLRDEPLHYRSFYIKAVATLGLLAFWLAALLTAAGQETVAVLLGPNWVHAGRIVQAFGPGIAPMILYQTHGWLFLSIGMPRRWFRWNVVATAVTITCVAIVARFGPVVVAATYSVLYYFLLPGSVWYGGRPSNTSLVSVLKPLLPVLLAGGGSVGVALFAATGIPGFSQWLAALDLLPRTLLKIGGVSALYFLFVVLFHGGLSPIERLVRITKMVLRRSK